jgi:hypothetical protein
MALLLWPLLLVLLALYRLLRRMMMDIMTTTTTIKCPEQSHTIIQALQWAGIVGICSPDVNDDNDDNKYHVEGDDSDSEKRRFKAYISASSAVETSTREQREPFFLPFLSEHNILAAALQWNGYRHDDKLHVLSLSSTCKSPTNSYLPEIDDDCTDRANDIIIEDATLPPPTIMETTSQLIRLCGKEAYYTRRQQSATGMTMMSNWPQLPDEESTCLETRLLFMERWLLAERENPFPVYTTCDSHLCVLFPSAHQDLHYKNERRYHDSKTTWSSQSETNKPKMKQRVVRRRVIVKAPCGLHHRHRC